MFHNYQCPHKIKCTQKERLEISSTYAVYWYMVVRFADDTTVIDLITERSLQRGGEHAD